MALWFEQPSLDAKRKGLSEQKIQQSTSLKSSKNTSTVWKLLFLYTQNFVPAKINTITVAERADRCSFRLVRLYRAVEILKFCTHPRTVQRADRCSFRLVRLYRAVEILKFCTRPRTSREGRQVLL